MPCELGGGTHRSWPGGRGGRPRALIPGEGVREGGKGTGAGLVDGAGQGLGRGCKGFGSGGVGGRGTGPRDGANFATCVVFLSFSHAYKKEEKWLFLKVGGYPPELAWWTGG